MTPPLKKYIDNIMPESFLRDVRKIFPGCHISAALIELQEITTGIAGIDIHSRLLHDAEIERYSAFSFLKRKSEYLAGRVAAKFALANFLELDDFSQLQDIHISNDQSGRPFAIPPTSCSTLAVPDISISHSKRFGCAIASDRYCGVDIQEPQDTLLRVYDKFCRADEEQLLSQCGSIENSIDRLTLLWAAKEAVRKSCSHRFIPGFQELSLISKETHSDSYSMTFSHRTGKSTVACRFIHGYGMAISLSEELL